MESAPLGQTLFVRTEITAMTWERRAQDIRKSDYHPIVINMMVKGRAQGDMDGRHFIEPDGAYHFHDLARPSLHGSTASLTYALVVPRDLAIAWFAPIERLHGLVVSGDAANAAMTLADTFWRLLPQLTEHNIARFERSLVELLAAGADMALPDAPAHTAPKDHLRAAAIAAIDQNLGLARASSRALCLALNVTSTQLAAAFRSDGGVQAYILARRLDEARSALTGLKRQEPIGNIAHRLGFSDAAHLSRAFRQRFGASPRAFRQLTSDATDDN